MIQIKAVRVKATRIKATPTKVAPRKLNAPGRSLVGHELCRELPHHAPRICLQERLAPKAELTVVERSLRPSSSTISSGSAELDVLPPSDAELRANPDAPGTQIHSMVLRYDFDVSPEGDSKEQQVVPRLQSLHYQLYDSPLDSFIWRLDDANGQPLQYGGAMHDASPTKLKKGSYTLSLLLRHTERTHLSALKNLPLMLRLPLDKPLA